MYKEILENKYKKTYNLNTELKYNSIGYEFYKDDEYSKGRYWIYETDDFIIDIHDFYIKKDLVFKNFKELSQYLYLYSVYSFICNGETFYPDERLQNNMVYATNMKNLNFKIIFHKNFPVLSVGIFFKEKFLEKFFKKSFDIDSIFFETRGKILSPLKKISTEILNCKMENEAAIIFFEAKAKEWLSIIIDEYQKKKIKKKISTDDKIALARLTNYINEHFNLKLSLEILSEITLMSQAKLKQVFKNEFNMSISEFIQKRRMDIAQNLLLNTDLSIESIAKSVGYTSASKFTIYFKKQKGILPSEMRKYKK